MGRTFSVLLLDYKVGHCRSILRVPDSPFVFFWEGSLVNWLFQSLILIGLWFLRRRDFYSQKNEPDKRPLFLCLCLNGEFSSVPCFSPCPQNKAFLLGEYAYHSFSLCSPHIWICTAAPWCQLEHLFSLFFVDILLCLSASWLQEKSKSFLGGSLV
jgi:hypothetical protein